MAKEKITLVQLRKLIATQTGFDENIVGSFLKQYFDVIANALKNDSQVRIKDFGSFRIQPVEPRRSVDVRTGESIIIDGYNKVVFAPSATLKQHVDNNELLNINQQTTTSANANNIAENDPIKKLGEQAEEIKDILAELGVTTDGEPEIEINENEQDDNDEVIVELTTDNQEPITSEPEITITEPEITASEPENNNNETQVEPVVKQTEPEIIIENNTEQQNPVEQPHTTKQTKRKRPWMTVGIIMLLLCILLVIAYFVLEYAATDWINNKLDEYRTEKVINDTNDSGEEELSSNNTDEPTADIENEIITQQDINTQENTPAQTQNHVVVDNYNFEILKTEVLTEGSRLAWLSRKYYGEPDFWVYIYLVNKQNISDPNDIPIGTEILIPKLPLEMIDTNDETVLQRAHDLQNKILNK